MNTAPELEQELELDVGPIMCESLKHSGQPPHLAHWYVSSPCMDVLAVCEQRRREARNLGGWLCFIVKSYGCRGYHLYENLEFHPIPPRS